MKPEQTAVSVVLIGNFKPAEFRLDSLEKANVLGSPDQAAASYEALVPDQVVVLVLPWGKMSVVVERLVVEVTQVPYVRGADLVLKLLNDVSPSSTVLKFGINMVCHYKFPSVAERDAFASRLVPPRAWGPFGAIVEKSFDEDSDRHGGVMKVQMRQARPPDRSAGWIDVTLEPSQLIPNNQGVAISLNDHYELSIERVAELRGSTRASSEELLGLLESNFDASVNRSFEICDGLIAGS